VAVGVARVLGSACLPSGPHSNGILVGNLLFVAGQGPFDESGRLVGSTFEDQLRKTIDNLELILKAAGADLNSIVKLSGDTC
jgi:2-iminobutanoate/2-iminopropanoate deaminase